MSVASVGSSVDLYSILQSVNGSSQSADSASSIASANDPNADDDGTSAASGEHHHGGHHHGSGISSKIESAVTDALKDAAPGSDPNQVIQSAIQNVLTGGTDTTNQQTNSSLIDNGSSQSAGGFNQLLQSFGVDPQQFHQDFQTAVQNVGQDGNGSVDFATLFQSFPPGSSVNTVG